MKRLAVLLSLGVLAACGAQDDATRRQRTMPEAIEAGLYQSDTLDAAEATARVVTLELKQDSTAVLTSVPVGTAATTQTGRFTADGKNLRVEIAGASDGSTLTFRWRLVSRRLVPVDWDRTVYGPAGLTLHLR